MLKKRLIGVVTVRQGWAVQSFGYRRYLPLGKPEVLVENLDRWGADEILVQCMDRTRAGLGPDFDLLERIGALGLSTPLIYAGGIRHAEDAVQAVRLGADRVAVDALLRDAPEQLEAMSLELGTQALIANLPVHTHEGALWWLNYRNQEACRLDEALATGLCLDWVSEVMLTDWRHEGTPSSFDETIPASFPLAGKPLVLFGGLSESIQFQRLLSHPRVVAAGAGNFLSYREHAIQHIKRTIIGSPVRPAHYTVEDRIL